MPGVLAVLSGADAVADKLNPIPHNPSKPGSDISSKIATVRSTATLTFRAGRRPVRHLGEAVAMVIAELWRWRRMRPNASPSGTSAPTIVDTVAAACRTRRLL